MDPVTVLTVTIPGVPPSVNNMHQHGRGRAWRTAEVDSYLSDVIKIVGNAAAWHQGLRARWRLLTRTGSVVAITMTWYRPDENQRDSSNVIKVLEDGIATALRVNDEYFEWTTRRAYDPKNPRVELTLSLEGAADG